MTHLSRIGHSQDPHTMSHIGQHNAPHNAYTSPTQTPHESHTNVHANAPQNAPHWCSTQFFKPIPHTKIPTTMPLTNASLQCSTLMPNTMPHHTNAPHQCLTPMLHTNASHTPTRAPHSGPLKVPSNLRQTPYWSLQLTEHDVHSRIACREKEIYIYIHTHTHTHTHTHAHVFNVQYTLYVIYVDLYYYK